MRAWLASLVPLLAVGCAELPVSKPLEPAALQKSWETHQSTIKALRNWSLQGRVGIKTQREGWTAALRWSQREDAYTLRLIAPLGQGTVELQGYPGRVVMRSPNQGTLVADDPESLLLSQLGWTLPLSGLVYWVRGIPDPEQPVVRIGLDGQGRMSDLQQSGWLISVLDYTRAGDLELPARLSMHSEHLQLQLAVQGWYRG